MSDQEEAIATSSTSSTLSISSSEENEYTFPSSKTVDALVNRFQSIQKRKENERNTILSECFEDFRKKAQKEKQRAAHTLPKITRNKDNGKTLKYEKIVRGGKKAVNIHQPVIVQTSIRNISLPSSTANTVIKTSFPVEDEEDLKFLPYFGENDHEDIVSELYDMSKRHKMLMVGAEYREKEISEIIEECRDLLVGYEEQNALSALLKIHIDFIKDHLQKDPSDSNISTTIPEKRKADSDNDTYEKVLDSSQELFCRRCLTYDCYKHGNLEKPQLKLQFALAMQKKKDKKTNSDTCAIVLPPFENNVESATPLTPEQKAMIPPLYQIFNGNLNIISSLLQVPKTLLPETVERYAIEESIIPPQPKRKKQSGIYTSMTNYNQTWVKRIESTSIKPLFYPCTHSEPCSDITCHCVNNGHFCTKHCVHSNQSRNFFRGCACKAGGCRTASCPCYSAKRECDPDLCKNCQDCTSCCTNNAITKRKHTHLLLAPSTVAGWGIYNKYPLKKGDFIQEYVGESMSQDEAERRGRIYDKINKSFLFNLCTDYVIDAHWKGNKTRYINHSSTPNVECRVVFVSGDFRIGLYAKEDIEAQSELFFDYKYDTTIENPDFTKPKTVVEWMKNPSMAGKVSSKNA